MLVKPWTSHSCAEPEALLQPNPDPSLNAGWPWRDNLNHTAKLCSRLWLHRRSQQGWPRPGTADPVVERSAGAAALSGSAGRGRRARGKPGPARPRLLARLAWAGPPSQAGRFQFRLQFHFRFGVRFKVRFPPLIFPLIFLSRKTLLKKNSGKNSGGHQKMILRN